MTRRMHVYVRRPSEENWLEQNKDDFCLEVLSYFSSVEEKEGLWPSAGGRPHSFIYLWGLQAPQGHS
jgi:hypothetical protein